MQNVPIYIKKALKEGTYPKEYRIQVLRNDGSIDFTINNDTLLAESVTLDERLVSGSVLRFGLCEGSSLEFQYYAAFGQRNISGRRLKCSVLVCYPNNGVEWHLYGYIGPSSLNPRHEIEVNEDRPIRVVIPPHTPGSLLLQRIRTPLKQWLIEDSDDEIIIDEIIGFESGDTFTYVFYGAENDIEVQYYDIYYRYSINLGYFYVSSVARQASTGIYKVTAYNKLKSEYLDAKANELLLSQYGATTEIRIADIERVLLSDFKINNQIVDIPSVITGENENTVVYLAQPYYFTALYGIQSPISAKEFDKLEFTASLTTPLYFGLESYSATYDVSNPDRLFWIINELAGRFDAFEENIIEQFNYYTVSAQIKKGQSGPVLRDRVFVNSLIASNEWQNVCCIELSYSNVTKRYSTAIWNYEEANELTHTVDGTFNDLIYKTQNVYSATVKIITPYALTMRAIQDGTTFGEIEYFFGRPEVYSYYVNEQHLSNNIYVNRIRYGDNLTEYIADYDYAEDVIEYNIGSALAIGYPTYGDLQHISVDITTLPEFTLRQILSADFESRCLFGQMSKTSDMFIGVELDTGEGLFPAETLYPANNRYPNLSPSHAAIHPYPSEYSQLWMEDMKDLKFRKLIYSYKTPYKDETFEKVINADGDVDYNMTDNWIFRNCVDGMFYISDTVAAIIEKLKDFRWFPFEMWLAGLPYIEVGDAIEIVDQEGQTHISHIFQRQLAGIQNLEDTYVNGELNIF